MPNTSKHPKKKSAVVVDQFTQYARNISEHVIETYGGSYQTYQTTGDAWRTCFYYSPKIENYVIRETKLYIRLLNLRDGMGTDPNFLYSFIDLISQYLAEYTARKNPPLTIDTEQERLQHILWDENPYIKDLTTRQAKKRYATFARGKTKYTNRNEHVARAKHDYNKAKDIAYRIVAISIYRKK